MFVQAARGPRRGASGRPGAPRLQAGQRDHRRERLGPRAGLRARARPGARVPMRPIERATKMVRSLPSPAARCRRMTRPSRAPSSVPPAYMAPEQMRGGEGRHAGGSVRLLCRALRSTPRSSALRRPKSVRGGARRRRDRERLALRASDHRRLAGAQRDSRTSSIGGLNADPERRYPTMDALIDALTVAPAAA